MARVTILIGIILTTMAPQTLLAAEEVLIDHGNLTCLTPCWEQFIRGGRECKKRKTKTLIIHKPEWRCH